MGQNICLTYPEEEWELFFCLPERESVMQQIKGALKKYWGYDCFLPLQEQAMNCVETGRDSIVVLPTGGGKSLCYQAPAVTLPGTAIVISPLISLMKDQVDALIECGVSAGRIDSSQSPVERGLVMDFICEGRFKLIYVSPERMSGPGFIDMLKRIDISFIAIDEAHCISMWGHDFRPEYRELGVLKETFPGIAIHAYTATATEEVRLDISRQLRLDNPEVMVGSFDRPNLIYRAERRSNGLKQVCEVLERHKDESGIIYCIRRTDVDEMCAKLSEKGYSARPYHAGMSDKARHESQELFTGDKVQIIVATIAFGMGIDKPNVRYVIHAGMPRSLENYQQESGRAGRDGLEAECHIFYSGEDYVIWKNLAKDMPPESGDIALSKLGLMYRYCTGIACRRRIILEYFGEEQRKENCSACDVCLGHLDSMEDSLVTAQKILSCIVRLHEGFGASYTALVLTGSRDQRILSYGHDRLSTYGLLSSHSTQDVMRWIDQLVSQECVIQTDDYRILKVTPKGWRVLKGQEKPQLLKPSGKPAKVARAARDSWEGVDRGLFERLRELRRAIAMGKGLPAYMVFGDAALRDMARLKPLTPADFLNVRGVGEKKRDLYGSDFLRVIRDYCAECPGGMGQNDDHGIVTGALRQDDERTETAYHRRLQRIRSRYPRAYEPWTIEEIQELQRYAEEGRTMEEIAAHLRRQPGAVRDRLAKIREYPDNDLT